MGLLGAERGLREDASVLAGRMPGLGFETARASSLLNNGGYSACH